MTTEDTLTVLSVLHAERVGIVRRSTARQLLGNISENEYAQLLGRVDNQLREFLRYERTTIELEKPAGAAY